MPADHLAMAKQTSVDPLQHTSGPLAQSELPNGHSQGGPDKILNRADRTFSSSEEQSLEAAIDGQSDPGDLTPTARALAQRADHERQKIAKPAGLNTGSRENSGQQACTPTMSV